MGKRAGILWSRMVVGGSLILVIGLLSPAAARASCGDYVSMKSHGRDATSTKPSTTSESPTTPVRPEPCPGPNCSGQPAPLSLPVTTPNVRPAQERLAAILTFALLSESSGQ